MIKKAKNTAILNEDVKPVQKAQVLEIPDSDYISAGCTKLNIASLSKYNLKSITIVKGKNTMVEIIKEA